MEGPDGLSMIGRRSGPHGRLVRRRGSAGAYLLADELVHRSATQSRRQLSVFGELGFGDFRVNRFGFYAAGAWFSPACSRPVRTYHA
jgi:hypothetical protein